MMLDQRFSGLGAECITRGLIDIEVAYGCIHALVDAIIEGVLIGAGCLSGGRRFW